MNDERKPIDIPNDEYYTPGGILLKLGKNSNSRMILYRMMKKGMLVPFYIGKLLTFRKSQNRWVFEK
jgi:hypothetical protein